MRKITSWTFIFFLMMAPLMHQSTAVALSLDEAIQSIANRLEYEQIKHGENAGSWSHEADFTGSIAAGMVTAYEWTCNSAYKNSAELSGDYIIRANAYKNSAELSGDYIIRAAQGNFYGDEAYALTRLSQITSDPCDNMWHTAVVDFYAKVKHEVSTEAYTSEFGLVDPSTAVFYLANYVVAAYYIGAEDKEVWRNALVDYLARVDDNSSLFPVAALGVATWALAATGPLNDRPIDLSESGADYWNNKKLADLPYLLLSHQVPDDELYAGSFYWRFDHGNGSLGGPVSGYTEDAIFATLGLIAAARANPASDLDAAIHAARQVLLGGLDAASRVNQHLWLRSLAYYVYAGEMLQVFGELTIPGDLDLDDVVNFRFHDLD